MIRTRFAPSPTGYMHIGNLRTALYEYLIAKSENGKFILRIEDTDQERFVEGATDIIYKTLKMAGINHDEGPDVGGEYGPYIQSQRKNNYLDYAKQLVEKGEAYYCFCDKDRLDSLKGEEGIAKYDRHCISLSKEEIEKNLKENIPYVIRQKIKEGKTTFVDEVYGEITVENEEMEDQILIKSDGLPTYNFANVIDDHLMNITHVVRGSEYLSSTPKYNLLYDAFGWDIPTYIHLPPVMKNQTEKLSKRNGDASFQDLIEKGYLPDAIVNYIALLGWSPSTNQEIFTLDELIQNFDVKGLSKSPAIFDIVKLTWVNSEYIKKMDFDKFFEMAEPVLKSVITKPYNLKKIAEHIKTRIGTINDIIDMVDFIEQLPEYSTELYIHKKMKTDESISLNVLKNILPVFENLQNWDNDSIYNAMMELVAKMEVKNGIVLWPVRTALSGKPSSPCGASEMAEIFGKEETLLRIKKGIEKLS
ncbi:glutamate--tRNA ligase [[Clostridium] colinum]|uniref:glutamate--tRNA ligase n=1 Tax=[Clostridium] colinum TaxID=36835 RepID=UPI002024F9D4|nr:glutamate--tRNA ligase [[Clostridium] colinum]